MPGPPSCLVVAVENLANSSLAKPMNARPLGHADTLSGKSESDILRGEDTLCFHVHIHQTTPNGCNNAHVRVHRQGWAMAIGDRLREERERLRLTQADFAEKAGIHRNTQARYEASRREPDSGYIETLRALGVDVDYVLFGIPDITIECPFLSFQGFNDKISLSECRGHASGLRMSANSLRVKHYAYCRTCKNNPINNLNVAPRSNHDVDGRLLEQIIEHIETVVSDTKLSLTSIKKARAIVLLYRSAVASGKIDIKAIKDTISLASD